MDFVLAILVNLFSSLRRGFYLYSDLGFVALPISSLNSVSLMVSVNSFVL